MTLNIKSWWPSFDAFKTEVHTHLRGHEAANNLILGLMDTHPGTPFSILASVQDEEQLLLAAIQTDSSMNLILSLSHNPCAAQTLAQGLRLDHPKLPGVLGPTLLARNFADQWCKTGDAKAEIDMRERIFAIESMPDIGDSEGAIRLADHADVTWLIPWVKDFTREAMPEAPVTSTEAAVERKILQGWPIAGFLVMEDQGVPVSIAGFGGRTGGGIRVGPVFTPKAMRNRGYGSRVVRELSSRLLQSGYHSVYLFTDLANPTSNSIYQKIGYVPVIDVDQYHFRYGR